MDFLRELVWEMVALAFDVSDIGFELGPLKLGPGLGFVLSCSHERKKRCATKIARLPVSLIRNNIAAAKRRRGVTFEQLELRVTKF